MGQIHSEEYQLDDGSSSSEDVADSELNLPSAPKKSEGDIKTNSKKQGKGNGTYTRKQEVPHSSPSNKSSSNNKKQQQMSSSTTTSKSPSSTSSSKGKQRNTRKLSNVSHRNIQLLSMRPQTEADAYTDGLKNRRRSSLINLILGAPSSGPRFSDDLCSLSSHQISEFNFGIEFFPDNIYQQHYNNQQHAPIAACTTPSISSIMGFLPIIPATFDQQLQRQHQHQNLSEKGQINASRLPLKATMSGPQAIANSMGPTSATAIADCEVGQSRRRRSSVGTLALAKFISSHGTAAYENYSHQGFDEGVQRADSADQTSTTQVGTRNNFATLAPSRQDTVAKPQQGQIRKPSLSSTLASIDLTSSFERHDKHSQPGGRLSDLAIHRAPNMSKTKQTIFESISQECLVENGRDFKSRLNMGRINQNGRVLRRSGSELSLYSTVSGASANASIKSSISGVSKTGQNRSVDKMKETKLIIMLQVCLPFILAGFGNMAAGLVLNKVAHWQAFKEVPIFFVLLPSFVGLKGNIEMTLASRLSTLSNLNLLNTVHERKRAYISNLVLILSQAIGLSVFASIIAILCEVFISGSSAHVAMLSDFKELSRLSLLIILPSALTTSMILVSISSVTMSLAVGLANLLRVNPDNLSTLIAALYGDVSCVFIYGVVADWIFSLEKAKTSILPICIISSTLLLWPVLLYIAYKLKETRTIALSSIPPMLTSIIISMGSGAILSIVVGRFSLIALYQPVVNGFGANLIAVQASRVSTWLWCSALRRLSVARQQSAISFGSIDGSSKKLVGSLASFTEPVMTHTGKSISIDDTTKGESRMLKLFEPIKRVMKIIFWSFCNSSPNSIAAKLLLLMLVPAHSLYFIVIWLVSDYVTITLSFYLVYVCLCLVQVFILLTICEPLMTLLMNRHFDPDIFGISILMALADLIGTICLASAFYLLEGLEDVNATLK